MSLSASINAYYEAHKEGDESRLNECVDVLVPRYETFNEFLSEINVNLWLDKYEEDVLTNEYKNDINNAQEMLSSYTDTKRDMWMLRLSALSKEEQRISWIQKWWNYIKRFVGY